MSQIKVKFDWNKNSSSSMLNLNHPDKPSYMTDKSSFGSGIISAFTSTGSSSNNNYCCLTEEGSRCQRVAGNASYSKRIQKIVQQKKLRLSIDNNARHVYICDHHKGMIQSVRGPLVQTTGKRKRKDEQDHDFLDDDIMGHDMGYHSYFDSDMNERKDVDLASLQVNTLRRYKKHFHVPAKPGLNKQQLSETLYRHFRSIPVNEKEAITFFIYMVKCNKNKLDREAGEASSSTAKSGNHLNHVSTAWWSLFILSC